MAASKTRAKAPPRKRARSVQAPTFVVGLGGSAGGLDAFEQFFASTLADTGMAFVVVTHQAPDHKALLPELLRMTTAMPVRLAEDGLRLARDTIYVIPPDRLLTLEGDVLRVRTSSKARGLRSPIDAFLVSLALARGTTAIGVILSGMGADGADGLRAIGAARGHALVQAPACASFPAMPIAAIAAVPTAAIAAPDALPALIASLTATTSPVLAAGDDAPPPPHAGSETDILHILDLVRRRTGHDLRLYKLAAIERRLERRLAVHRLPTIAAYAAYLDQNPEEADLLFRELLIGVTHFFRDENSFVVLRDVALPALLATKRTPRSLRAWVAGCSTGEEAYSLAIIIHELLTASHADEVSVQIYATDIDAAAITTARAGLYPHSIADQVSSERLARYFLRDEHGYRIRKSIRETVVFAQHDLIIDPPFTRLDVLCCRNVLIYMQPALQQQILPKFHYALGPDGLLVLGASETATAAAGMFTAVDHTAKVYRRLDLVRGPSLRGGLAPTATRTAPAPVLMRGNPAELTLSDAARAVIVEHVAAPTVVINDRGDILYASRRTGRYLEPAVGKSNINIFAMARAGLTPHLSLAVRQATSRRRPVTMRGVALRADRGNAMVDLTVMPMTEPPALAGLLLVSFVEQPKTSAARRGGTTPRPSTTRDLSEARAHLQTVVREMEASQAQVEASNEALQSANEELQSTNEELTTSREELQSLNEELLTLTAEQDAKNRDLGTANDDLRNLINSTKVATLFLDNQLRIKRFTSEATLVANVIAGDVGRAITDITLKVAYPGLAADATHVIETLVSREAQVTSASGATYTARIHPYRTTDNVIDGVVITFSDVTALRRAEEALAARAHDGVIARLLDRWPGLVSVVDLDEGRDVYLNDGARLRMRDARPPLDACARFAALLHPDDAAADATWLTRLSALRDGDVISRPMRLRDARGGYEPLRARASVLARRADGAPSRVLSVIEAVLPEQEATHG